MQLRDTRGEFLLQRQHLPRAVTTRALHIGIKTLRLAEHRVLNLRAQYAAHAAKVLADGIHLARGTKKIFAVANDIAGGQIARRVRVESLADGMPDVHRLRPLPVTVDTPVALLHHIRIPRDLHMDHVLAEVVEVDALGGGIGREEYAHGRCLARTRLEGVDHGVALFAGECPVEEHHRFAAVAMVRKNRPEPCVGVHELREEDDALVVELAVRSLQVFVQPFQDRLRLGVFRFGVPLRPLAKLVEDGRLPI